MSFREDFGKMLKITADDDDDDVLVIGIDFGTTYAYPRISHAQTTDEFIKLLRCGLGYFRRFRK
jgi:hypothetical protein